MKAFFVFTGSGPIVLLTSLDDITDPQLVQSLSRKGICKFVAHELPLETVKRKYGRHYDIVCKDWHETDEMRVLDYLGNRAFELFSFQEFGPPIYYEKARPAPP